MDVEILAIGVFGLTSLLVFYTYVGYPILVFVVARLFPRTVERERYRPKVTVLITAYNEEAGIEKKILNTLRLDYPKDKLEILVASDASSDGTDDIVNGFASQGVKFFRQEGRKGKTWTQNEAVKLATGEIILFSDATTHYSPDVLENLLPSFSDDSVGCVAGRLIYVANANGSISSGARKYWGYETFLRENESLACSLIGASGCLYAVRKEAYVPMYREACSDFLICSLLYENGLRSVFEPSAVCYEDTNEKSQEEIRMRIRVIAQTYSDLWKNRRLLNPLRTGFYGIQLISHKLLRYLVPIFLLFNFLSSLVLALTIPAFVVLAGVEIALLVAALIGLVLEKSEIKIKLFSLPMYFLLTNYTSMVGLLKFFSGENFAAWETGRKSEGQ
ncbi:MAG: glycosyltransferase family 2 protein [Pyrinomonadaceae bacterium]